MSGHSQLIALSKHGHRLRAWFYSFEAASLSKNQVSSPSGETIWTGNLSELWEPPSAVCTTGALPAPATTSAIWADELITGKVKVILSGGGLGESLIKVTHFSFSFTSGCPGNKEATCPSGPIPRSIRSNLGNPVLSDDFRTSVLTRCFRQVS